MQNFTVLCSIVVGVLSISYPLILQMIAKIEGYKSKELLKILRLDIYSLVFIYLLYITIALILIKETFIKQIIINIKLYIGNMFSLWGYENFLTFISKLDDTLCENFYSSLVILLVISFFFLMKKLLNYSSIEKITDDVNEKFEKLTQKRYNERKKDTFIVIIDLLVYAINSNDDNIIEKNVKFLTDALAEERNQYAELHKNDKTIKYIYEFAYEDYVYENIHRLCRIVAENKVTNVTVNDFLFDLRWLFSENKYHFISTKTIEYLKFVAINTKKNKFNNIQKIIDKLDHVYNNISFTENDLLNTGIILSKEGKSSKELDIINKNLLESWKYGFPSKESKSKEFISFLSDLYSFQTLVGSMFLSNHNDDKLYLLVNRIPFSYFVIPRDFKEIIALLVKRLNYLYNNEIYNEKNKERLNNFIASQSLYIKEYLYLLGYKIISISDKYPNSKTSENYSNYNINQNRDYLKVLEEYYGYTQKIHKIDERKLFKDMIKKTKKTLQDHLSEEMSKVELVIMKKYEAMDSKDNEYNKIFENNITEFIKEYDSFYNHKDKFMGISWRDNLSIKYMIKKSNIEEKNAQDIIMKSFLSILSYKISNWQHEYKRDNNENNLFSVKYDNIVKALNRLKLNDENFVLIFGDKDNLYFLENKKFEKIKENYYIFNNGKKKIDVFVFEDKQECLKLHVYIMTRSDFYITRDDIKTNDLSILDKVDISPLENNDLIDNDEIYYEGMFKKNKDIIQLIENQKYGMKEYLLCDITFNLNVENKYIHTHHFIMLNDYYNPSFKYQDIGQLPSFAKITKNNRR